MENKKVKIYYDKDVDCKDEWWCNWYECPECGGNSITDSFSFCPDCGIEIDEIIEVDNQTALKETISKIEIDKKKNEELIQQLKSQLKEKKND